MIQSLEGLAEIAAARGDAEQAARHLGASAALGTVIGVAVPVFVRAASCHQTRSRL